MAGDMAAMMEAAPSRQRGMTGAMQRMTRATPTESPDDADADCLPMMIPRHQGAIAMARVQIERGGDEATRAMAQAIVDAREGEIEGMRALPGRMGAEAPAAPAG